MKILGHSRMFYYFFHLYINRDYKNFFFKNVYFKLDLIILKKNKYIDFYT